MKPTLMIKFFKSLVLLIFIFLIGPGGKCADRLPLSDTDNVVHSANSSAEDDFSNVSNVIFPTILEKHKDQALEYVHKFSEKKRAYLISTFNNGKKLFPRVVTILKRFNLPKEFRVLIALESGFNPNAISIAGAVGYWQFMDEVAKEYGLKIKSKVEELNKPTKEKDERKNFNKSTYAAARYLKDRSKNLNNDILLTVASYNWGIGHIREAMRKTGKSDPTFWDIRKYVPLETRNYIMNFIALNVIFNNYEKFSRKALVFNSSKKSEIRKIDKEAADPESCVTSISTE